MVTLIDHARDAIIVLQVNGDIVYWNKSAERLYGWNSYDAKNLRLLEIIHKKSKNQFSLAKEEVLKTGEWSGELRQITKLKKEIVVESRWTLQTDRDGENQSILIINTDITDKKNIETQLLRSQRLDSLGKLASGIAHDLNNVLTPITVSIELLLRKVNDEGIVKILKNLESGAERGKEIVKQVLTFSRGYAGEKSIIDPSDALGEIRRIIKDTISSNIQVTFTEEKTHLSIEADPTQIHQVILNLIVNACDAMPSGGSLNVTLTSFEADENFCKSHLDAKPGQYVVYSVSDTGFGISSESIEKIFEPFFTTKEIGKGTGHGLSTVFSIVKSHGGFISVYSELNAGSEFKIFLPVVFSKRIKKISKLEFDYSGNGELILLVDDDESIQSAVKEMLVANGYNVIIASNGQEAVDLFSGSNGDIGLVLTDMMMPKMDGISTIRKLKVINPNVRIIASSGLNEEIYSVELNKNRVKSFLHKPYTAKDLLKAVYVELRNGILPAEIVN